MDEMNLFTPALRKDLIDSGFTTLFEIITLLPFRYTNVTCYQHNKPLSDKEVYLFEGIIQSIQKKPNHYLIDIMDKHSMNICSFYYFAKGSYITKIFTMGSPVQAEIQRQKQFLVAKKISLFKYSSHPKPQLGYRAYEPYIIPIYPTKSKITTHRWQVAHSFLQPSHYILNFEKLIPPSDFIPQRLSLEPLHKSSNMRLITQTTRHYSLFKMFIKLAQIKYITESSKLRLGVGSQCNREFLTTLSQNLEYELTHSQKQAIWSVLSCFQPQDSSQESYLQTNG